MKEFLLGGAVAIWFIILGLSTLSITLTILAIAYPIFILLIIANYLIIKKYFAINKKRHITA